MKKILFMILVFAFNAHAIDFKEKLIEAAKDKENQEKAKEVAKQAVEYIKEKTANKEEVKIEPTKAPVPEAPKKVVTKKKAKKK